MRIEDSRRIQASPHKVWEALNDPEILKACLPGCESFERLGPTRFQAVVVQRIGPLSASFTGELSLENLDPPQSYTLVGKGVGGAAGHAEGAADVSISPEDDGARLDYALRAEVTGRLAKIGLGLVEGFARRMAAQFFERFTRILEGRPVEEPPSEGKSLWRRLIG